MATKRRKDEEGELVEMALPEEMDALARDIETTRRQVRTRKLMQAIQTEKLRQQLAELQARTTSAEAQFREQEAVALALQEEKALIQQQLESLQEVQQASKAELADLSEYEAQIKDALQRRSTSLSQINQGLRSEIATLESELDEASRRQIYLSIIEPELEMTILTEGIDAINVEPQQVMANLRETRTAELRQLVEILENAYLTGDRNPWTAAVAFFAQE